MTNPSEKTILINGAGLGGLTLAQVLREHGIPFKIFERDEEHSVRPQGWAVILQDCLPGMERLLPEKIKDIRPSSVNYAVGDTDGGTFFDIQEDRELNRIGGVSKGQPGYFIRASREALRQHLMQDLPIHWSKNLRHYDETEDGVIAHFADGSSYQGAMLVAADGAHSHIRRQLLGHGLGDPKQSNFIPLWGTVTLTPEQYEPIREMASAVWVASAPGIRYLVGQRSLASKSRPGIFYWDLNYYSEDPAAEDHFVQHATQEQLYKKALDITQNWPDRFKDIIHRHSKPKDMAMPPVRFLEYSPPETLPSGRIVLIGDALHTMIPFRGLGANSAISDAVDLAELLIPHWEKLNTNEEWLALQKEYNKVAVPRARLRVQASHDAGSYETVVKDAEAGRKIGGGSLYDTEVERRQLTSAKGE